jgi:hypothetical protein
MWCFNYIKILKLRSSDYIDWALHSADLTSYASIKAIEVSEKEHGCDLKTTFINLNFLMVM